SACLRAAAERGVDFLVDAFRAVRRCDLRAAGLAGTRPMRSSTGAKPSTARSRTSRNMPRAPAAAASAAPATRPRSLHASPAAPATAWPAPRRATATAPSDASHTWRRLVCLPLDDFLTAMVELRYARPHDRSCHQDCGAGVE